MAVFRLERIAHPGDSRWQDRPQFDEIVVEAPAPALARRRAAKLELSLGGDLTRVGNEGLASKAGVEDEKLYRVVRLSEQAAKRYRKAPSGPGHVLHYSRTPAAEPA